MKYLVLLLLVTGAHGQEVVTVGTDDECDVTTLSSALSVGNRIIRVTNQVMSLGVTVRFNGEIHGGYANCTDAANDVKSGPNTTISGNTNQPAIRIQPFNNAPVDVVISGLTLMDGVAAGGDHGGGLSIEGPATVMGSDLLITQNEDSGVGVDGSGGAALILSDVEITTNTGTNGGGVLVKNGAQVLIRNGYVHRNTVSGSGGGIELGMGATVTIEDSRVNNNIALGNGGGIHCWVNGQLDINQSTEVANNSARFGGGVSVSSCVAEIQTGDALIPALSLYGINNNQADIAGGGVYVLDSQVTLKGSAGHFLNIIGNESGLPGVGFSGEGVGIYARGAEASVRIINGRIIGNTGNFGVAMSIREQAQLVMKRFAGGCPGTHCSEISGNVANTSVIAAQTCGVIKTFQTLIADNQFAAAMIELEGDEGALCAHLYEGNLFMNNGASGRLFRLDRSVGLDFAFNTVVDPMDTFNIANTNATNQKLTINASIFWNQPGTVIDDDSANSSFSGQCFLVPVPNALPAGFGPVIIADDPAFNDPANLDFRLTFLSPPLDQCDANARRPRHHDMFGVPRGVAITAPTLGYLDMGAFEFNQGAATDVIFYDRFDD